MYISQSMSPVVSMGSPGNALAIAETARDAVGLLARPLTPLCVVWYSILNAGQAYPHPISSIKPETVIGGQGPQRNWRGNLRRML